MAIEREEEKRETRNRFLTLSLSLTTEAEAVDDDYEVYYKRPTRRTKRIRAKCTYNVTRSMKSLLINAMIAKIDTELKLMRQITSFFGFRGMAKKFPRLCELSV